MTSKLGQPHLKSDRETLFTLHIQKKKKGTGAGAEQFPQKTAKVQKLGTPAKDTKSVSMLKGKQVGGWGRD